MTRAQVKANMTKLIEQRDQLFKEIEALRNKIAGIEMAISLLDGDLPVNNERKRGRRGNVKGLLLNMLMEVGTSGLNASSAVEISERRGVPLDRATVSSLLSRLKADGAVDYDGTVYRLKKFTKLDISDLV